MNINGTTKKLINIALLLLIAFLAVKIAPVLSPLYKLTIFLITPIILAIYTFYSLRPLRVLLSKQIKNNTLASVIVFILFIIVLFLLLATISNLFISQLRSLVNQVNFENFVKNNEVWIEKLPKSINLQSYIEKLSAYISSFVESLPSKITYVASSVGNIGTQVVLYLLATYYLLSGENELAQEIKKVAKGKNEKEILETTTKIHEMLKIYISGQIMVSIILGTLMYLGYLIIGLPYAFLMAIIATVTNLIPFIGPFLGGLPAVFIGLTNTWVLAIKVIVVSVVVQQLESNLITPNITGSKLSLHPFVVIIVVLAGLNLFGVLGALIATPLYIGIKSIVEVILAIYKKNRVQDM
ncbi:MAG: AI-2E family transporter [Tissierellia bacterium]|nr:AI-2E family transporter [Tissierellia bacterium]